jgi:hypothetical protein
VKFKNKYIFVETSCKKSQSLYDLINCFVCLIESIHTGIKSDESREVIYNTITNSLAKLGLNICYYGNAIPMSEIPGMFVLDIQNNSLGNIDLEKELGIKFLKEEPKREK